MRSMTSVELRQLFSRLNLWLVIAAFFAAPFLTVILGLCYIIAYKRKRIVFFQIASVVLLVVLVLSAALFPGSRYPSSYIDCIFHLKPGLCIIVPAAFLSVSVFGIGEQPVDDLLLQELQKKRAQSYVYSSEVPVTSRLHCFIAGTTGSGKTTAITHFVEDSMKKNEPLFIVSGKCGTGDKYSLQNQTKRLAEKYERKMCLISLCAHEKDRQRYNPVSGMSPGAMADMMIAINEFSEPYYRDATMMWLKIVGEVLIMAKIPLSMEAISDFYTYDSFFALVTELQTIGAITPEQLRMYSSYKNYAEIAENGRIKLLNLLRGECGDVFSADDHAANAVKALNENTVFFVDLDSFAYDAFTAQIGAIAIHDICRAISSSQDPQKKKRIIFDEISCYATPKLLGIFSRARSYGFQCVTATQSIADLNSVSDTFASVLLENAGQYLVLQLNDADDAERMAGIIGTFERVDTTYKSSGPDLDESGTGSKRFVHEYKVPPDMIKELPPLQAIYYNKADPAKVHILKIPFVSP